MPEVTGFQRPTFTTIHDRIQADLNTSLPGAEARLRRAVLNVLSRAIAGAIHLLYGFISFIARNVIIDTAQAEWLVRHASLWGIIRKAATFAQGNVTIAVRVDSGPVTVPSNIVIPIGTVLQRADGELFTTNEEATLLAGTASSGSPIEDTVLVTAQSVGIIGNTEFAVSLPFLSSPSPIALTVLVDLGGITNGQEEESDDALRERVLLRIQEPPMGGTAQDYVAWTLEVLGVTRVWVFPLEEGAGTVTVRFVKDGNFPDIIPLPAEVQEVQDYLEIKRPVTAQVIAEGPVADPQPFTIAVDPDTPTVRAAIITELEDFYLRDGAPGATIYLSRVGEAIASAPGEFRHELIVPFQDKAHQSFVLPQLGTVTWSAFP